MDKSETFTPIIDCEHKDAVDGCCSHPKNCTPECHVWVCPRLNSRIYAQFHFDTPGSGDRETTTATRS